MSEFITMTTRQTPTFILVLVLVFLLWTLAKSADILVDEAISLSIHLGIPQLIIGSTIVALATSLPEVAISVIGALQKSPDIALGNAVGSIIANSGLVMGLVILYGNIPVDRLTLRRHGIIQFGAGLMLIIFALPFMTLREGGNISQWVGLFFLFLMGTYVYLSIHWSAKYGTESIEYAEEDTPIWLQVLKMVLGAALLIVSSRLLITVVQVVALRIGIPQAVIAATLVAFGTSLPELVTTISAVRKGHGELAVGNIVGSDIMNVLLVVGASAAVTPGGLQVSPSFYWVVFPAMMIILTIFRWGQVKAKPYIPHIFGGILLLVYVVFLILNFTWLS